MFKSKLSIFLFSIVLCASLLGAFGVQAECSTGCSYECPTGCPQFNNCSGDLELLTFKNRTQNTADWQSSISANPGDTIAFNVYYHNCITESTANNTRIRIDFTNVETSPIVTTAYLWAENASYVTDSGNISLTTPQKLNFASTAKWYPNQTNSNPTMVSVTVNVTSAEVSIGSIQGGWPAQGWVVFEATLSGAPSVNNPPTANAGSDKDVQEGNSTTLNGSGNDPDGDSLTYSWTCNGGNLSNYNVAQPTYTAPQTSGDTNYTCTLTVNDGEGGSDSDWMNVYVRNNTPVNHAPTANAGPDKDAYENQSVTLDGSGYDQDGDYLTYSWSCNGGNLSSYNIARPTYNAPSVSYNNYYTCILTVRDDEGLTSSDSMVVYVRDQATRNLYVSLIANPSSGNAPLNNVSLTANISGTALGSATYKFDCTNDGSWERISTSDSNSYTASNLCNYSSTGNYTAKVEVNRDGITNSATAIVYVYGNSQSVNLTVIKSVKNISDGTAWLNTVIADPGEVLYFSIQVTAGNNVQNVSVKDILPGKISYEGELKLDDIFTSGDIFNGLNIGDLSAGQTRTITFKAMVAGSNQFVFGTTELINTAQAYGSNSSSFNGTAKVSVTKTAVAGAITEIVTGVNPLYISLIVAFLLALVFYFLWTNLEKSQNPSARKFLSQYYRAKSLLFK